MHCYFSTLDPHKNNFGVFVFNLLISFTETIIAIVQHCLNISSSSRWFYWCRINCRNNYDYKSLSNFFACFVVVIVVVCYNLQITEVQDYCCAHKLSQFTVLELFTPLKIYSDTHPHLSTIANIIKNWMLLS